MAKKNHRLTEPDKRTPFPVRLQQLCDLWVKKNETIQKHQMKLLELWASGFFDPQYGREHLINLIDRGVFTIVPYLVEGNPKVEVSTLITNYKDWAYTTQLALNFWTERMHLAEKVLIPVAINSMFGAGITRVFREYDRFISLENKEIKIGHPVVKVIHDSDYIGDPLAKSRDDFVFEGDIYKLPTDYAKDLFAGKDDKGNEIADYIEPDCKLLSDYKLERITQPGFNIEKMALRDHTTFIDLYLNEENVVVTIMPMGKKAKILRTIEEDGPKESPYDYLGYKYFPGCSVPIPPAWFWHDCDVSMNVVAEKAREQAESQKDVIIVDGANRQVGEQILNARNLDVLESRDAKDGINKISVGGMNPQHMPWFALVEDNFNKSGGTPQIMRGNEAEAPTLGQEKMIYQNASRIVNSMMSRYHDFQTSILKKLAYRLWTDPTVYIPVIRTIPGVGDLTEVFSQADKVGEFYDFVFRITPYSTQRFSPETKFNRLMQLGLQWILPTMQYGLQQGAEFDVPAATEKMFAYLGFDDFGQLYKSAVPRITDNVPYQMQPMKNQQMNTGGMSVQGNDSFGSMLGNRTVNSNRQQSVVDAQEVGNV